jgi:1-phosphatidylinositol-3-phosphate 5-kinase
MYSFGKFLELLTFSKTFRAIQLSLCQHTSPQGSSDSQTAQHDRHNILRHFARGDTTVTFATAPVGEVYDVRVPRMQIVHDKDVDRKEQDATVTNVELEPEQEAVKQEIRKWWDGLRGHLRELVSHPLPLLPVSY